MTVGSKYCSTCRSTYRTGFAVHASTAQHRERARPSRHQTRHELRDALGYTRLSIRRALAGDSGENAERVRAHRRSPPNDGARKIVKIHRYWRHRVSRWRPGGIPWLG